MHRWKSVSKHATLTTPVICKITWTLLHSWEVKAFISIAGISLNRTFYSYDPECNYTWSSAMAVWMQFLLEHGHFPGSRHVHSLRLDRKYVVWPHQKPKELIPDLICMDTLEAELTSRKPLYCFKKWGKQHTAPDIKGLRAALMKCSDAFSKKIRERKQMAEQKKKIQLQVETVFSFISCKGSGGCSFSCLDHVNVHASFSCTRGLPALRWPTSAYLSDSLLS